MSTVSLIQGDIRRENVRKSLELIAHNIKKSIGTRQVIIKPNFVSTSIQLASTHIDHIRGILDFLGDFYKEKVIIGEAAAGNTMEGYKRFGYNNLLKEYNIELIDLNRGAFEKIPILDMSNRTIYVSVSSLLLDRDNYLISATRLKTHDTVVVTLSVKNTAMGCVLYPDKENVHQGVIQINKNIAQLAGLVWPDLASIDGFEGMEGNGPIFGDPIYVGVALASNDPLAADRVSCEIMGVEASRVGYLSHCAADGLGEFDLERIEILGAPLNNCRKHFRLHSTVEMQYSWM